MSILQELSRLRLYAIGTPDERRAVLRVRRLGIHNGKVLHARKGRPDQPMPVAAAAAATTPAIGTEYYNICPDCGKSVLWGSMGPKEYHDCKGGTIAADKPLMPDCYGNFHAGKTKVRECGLCTEVDTCKRLTARADAKMPKPLPVAADKPAPATGPACFMCGEPRGAHQPGTDGRLKCPPIVMSADQPAGDNVAVEALAKAMYDHYFPDRPWASEIESNQQEWRKGTEAGVAAIRRGEVPGIWATRLDPEKVRNAHMEEIADLRAKLERAQSLAGFADTRAARDKALADLATANERAAAWEKRAIELAHDPKADARPVIEEWLAKAERAWSECHAAKEDAERAKMERNGMHVKNYREWMDEYMRLIRRIDAALGQVIRLPPYRYIKDRGVSDYTYSAHADGYDDCLEDIAQLLDLHGIPFEMPKRCTKEDLRTWGVDDE